MNRNSDFLRDVILLVIAVILVILVHSAPPHTSPNVEKVEWNKANVPNNSQLVLWVSSGKSSQKFVITNGDGVRVEGLFYDETKVIPNGTCDDFWILLFTRLHVCNTGDSVTVEWPFGTWADKLSLYTLQLGYMSKSFGFLMLLGTMIAVWVVYFLTEKLFSAKSAKVIFGALFLGILQGTLVSIATWQILFLPLFIAASLLTYSLYKRLLESRRAN